MSNSARKSASISPTAHYTGQVWLRHGLSNKRLETGAGAFFYSALSPIMKASSLLGGPTLEDFLLARHHLIDHLLARAIESGEVTQVIEIAAGLSPRGLRFAKKYGDAITYIEADLSGMARMKQERLQGITNHHHKIVTLNALTDSGEDSLAALASTLDHTQGLAIVTEGLLNYFDQESVTGMWRRFAATLGGFSSGLYLSDIHLSSQNYGPLAEGFKLALSTFVRSRVHLHFQDNAALGSALARQGFGEVTINNPRSWADDIPSCNSKGASMVRIIEART